MHPAPDLVAELAHFAASGERWGYIDRHVLDVLGAVSPDPALVRSACADAMALARAWSAQRAEASRTLGCLVTAPVVIIDDEWLRGDANAAPPHVYISFARDQSTLDSLFRPAGRPCASSGNDVVDALLTGAVTLSRSEPALDDEPGGAWLLAPTA